MRSDAGVLAYPWYSLSIRKINKAVSITFFLKRGKVQNKSHTIKGGLAIAVTYNQHSCSLERT